MSKIRLLLPSILWVGMILGGSSSGCERVSRTVSSPVSATASVFHPPAAPHRPAAPPFAEKGDVKAGAESLKGPSPQESLQELQELWQIVQSFPEPRHRSRHFQHTGLLPNRTDASAEENTLRRRIADRLGATDEPEVREPQRNRGVVLDVAGKLKPDLEEIRKQLGDGQRLAWVRLAGLPTLLTDGKIERPAGVTDADFIAYLKRLQVDPERAKLKTLDEARLELGDRSSPLYYHSVRFVWEKQREHLAAWTRAIEAAAGKEVGVAVPMRPDYASWQYPAFWVDAHRQRALTMPWAIAQLAARPIFSPQVGGWTLSVLRSAAREGSLPIQWTPFASTRYQSAEDLRRDFWLAVAHGAKRFDWGGLDPIPSRSNPEPLRAASTDQWRMIRDLIEELAELELNLLPPPRRANVAILVSLASDLYGDPGLIHAEREALYFALRFAHYAVDCITEADVQTGALERYKSVLFVGNHLERATVRPLKLYLEAGNAFAIHGGGALRDEFNQPLHDLDDVLGISQATLEVGPPLKAPKDGLRSVKPLDRIHWKFADKERDFEALGLKVRFQAKDQAIVFARYSDGSPAIIRHDWGTGMPKGMTFVYGSLVATSFIKQFVPPGPWEPGAAAQSINHRLPEISDLEIGDLVVAATSEAVWHVVTDNLVVETELLEGPGRLAMVCINWSAQPQTALLTVQGPAPNFTKARSLKRGPLKMTTVRDPRQPNKVTYTVTVNVEVTDVVVFEK